MNNQSEKENIILQVLGKAGWAPLAVIISHAIAARFGIRERLDWLMHLLGGVAMSFFFYRTILIIDSIFGRLHMFIVYLLAFSLTCTIALFWEFGEYFSDQVLGTHTQQSLTETMQDLLFGVLGAFMLLIIIFIISWLQKRILQW